jgi:hypothetical protein
MTKNKDPLSDFFRLISEEKAMAEKKEDDFLSKLNANISEDLNALFSQINLASKEERSLVCEIGILPPVLPVLPAINEEEKSVVIEEESLIERSLGILGGTSGEKTSDPLTPLNQKFMTLEDFNKHYRTFVERIQQQLSTLGGGGEVNLRYLDDVARETIDDGLFLKYNGTSRKFEFANVNANALITNTTYVTTSEYTVQDDDYYLGVDYAGPTTIILPVSDTNGRCIVIKDEDGDAETNPITVQGTVDNDAGGFILQINNGSIQLIYRNGWRII